MKVENQEKLIVKPFKKLRIIDNNIIEDNRVFQSIQRKITGDSRYKTLDYLKTDLNNKEVLYTLKNTTYKNDAKFVQEVNKIFDSTNEYKESNYKNVDMNVEFINACRNGDVTVVKQLIEKCVNIQYDDGLQWSTGYGCVEVVKLLLENGANVHAKNDAALCLSAQNGHLEVVKILLDKGANIHADDDYALRFSAMNGHLQVVKVLLENNANIHAYDDCIIKLAAKNGEIEIVKVLLEHGANIHADDNYALRFSAMNGHVEVVKVLLKHSADVHVDDDYIIKLAEKNEEFKKVIQPYL